VDFLDKLFDYHFFRVNCPEKRDFSNSKCNFYHLYHHTNYFPREYFSLHATTIGSFFPSLRDLDSRLGGCGIRGIDYLFFEYIRRVSKEDSSLM
jgi:hypothetical protein